MRDDLSRVYSAVQACHAAIGGGQFLIPQNIPHPHLVLCKASSEEELKQIASRLGNEGVRHYLFVEPDLPPSNLCENGQFTALITEPILSKERRRLFRRYQCVK